MCWALLARHFWMVGHQHHGLQSVQLVAEHLALLGKGNPLLHRRPDPKELAHFIEGTVSQFIPMPYTGHAMESFVVHGVRFAYSDYVITAGFNNTSSHGGPIREGLPVRIWYRGNEILRLDVAKRPNQALQPTAGRSDI